MAKCRHLIVDCNGNAYDVVMQSLEVIYNCHDCGAELESLGLGQGFRIKKKINIDNEIEAFCKEIENSVFRVDVFCEGIERCLNE